MSDEIVEVAYTQNAGWCWRCHLCDINQFNLAEDKARAGAREHEDSVAHGTRLAEVS